MILHLFLVCCFVVTKVLAKSPQCDVDLNVGYSGKELGCLCQLPSGEKQCISEIRLDEFHPYYKLYFYGMEVAGRNGYQSGSLYMFGCHQRENGEWRPQAFLECEGEVVGYCNPGESQACCLTDEPCESCTNYAFQCDPEPSIFSSTTATSTTLTSVSAKDDQTVTTQEFSRQKNVPKPTAVIADTAIAANEQITQESDEKISTFALTFVLLTSFLCITTIGMSVVSWCIWTRMRFLEQKYSEQHSHVSFPSTRIESQEFSSTPSDDRQSKEASVRRDNWGQGVQPYESISPAQSPVAPELAVDMPGENDRYQVYPTQQQKQYHTALSARAQQDAAAHYESIV
jgi:hypothetical protein